MSKKDNERYYWFKLKDSLLTSEKVDFLMRQKGGSDYVVLYQCLCLKLVNNDGVLAVKLGDDIYVPYSVEKIQGETKGWFSIDTIRVALELFKKLGLIYQLDNGFLRITDFEELIGSETHAAERMRITRANNGRTKSEHCSLDIRDEDIREESIDIRESNIREITNDKTRYNEIKANGFAGELFLKLVDSGYVSLYELDTNDYIKFLKELLSQYEVVDIKIKVEYFLRVTCHYLPIGKDKQDKPIFGYRYKEENQIGNKFLYFKTTITNAFNPKEYLTEQEQLELQKIMDELGQENTDTDDDDSLPF